MKAIVSMTRSIDSKLRIQVCAKGCAPSVKGNYLKNDPFLEKQLCASYAPSAKTIAKMKKEKKKKKKNKKKKNKNKRRKKNKQMNGRRKGGRGR